MRNPRMRVPVIIGAVILLAIGVYYIPPVHERLAWRVEGLRTQVKYFFNPPDEAVFQPSEQQQVEAIVSATMQAFLATPTRTATPRPGPSLTPTVTTTPLPDVVMLEGVTYEHQHGRLNYCGPANFSMSLTFWGWDGDRDVIGQAVKPSDKDKNVMPYELQDYITDNVPGMTSVLRYGGEIEMIKRLVAAGFPVVVEKGIYELDLNGKFGWMGHYAFVTGYDETKQELIYQDTYQPPGAPAGPNRRISYDDFTEGWRSFNFVFVVVYPVEREAEVLSALGNWADEAWATRHALERAQAEGQSLTGIDQFFAWFNAGTSHVDLLQYADASIAYDYAFQLYADLDVDNSIRPYRTMWYQTGPYKAYFYSGRYADVISLANTTLHDTISEPVLEESLYWRGQAEYMAGQTGAAIADYRAALKVHPKWLPALQALQDLGVEP
ncbi:MAG: C39 family peptidase [Chloroflexota bacterium]